VSNLHHRHQLYQTRVGSQTGVQNTETSLTWGTRAVVV